MAYVLLFIILLVWAVLALRGQPLRPYACIYFITDVGAYWAEFLFSGVFHFYRYRSYWLADPFHDARLTAVFVVLGIDPLFQMLYARYCRKHPVWMALAFAALVSGCEVVFRAVGAMTYPVGWGPVLSFLVAVPAFLLVWRIHSGAIRIPHWLVLDAVAFYISILSDCLFHGGLWFYHYNAPAVTGDMRVDSRILAAAYTALIQAPLSIIPALVPKSRRLMAGAGILALLMGVEMAGLATGVIIYDHWNLGFAFLYYLAGILVPLLYDRWSARAPQGRGWEPPVWPRSHRDS